MERPDDRIAEIRARHAAATAGVWTWEDDPPTLYAGRDGIYHGLNLLGRLDPDMNGPANMAFISESHQDIPWLLDALAAATARAESAEAERDAANAQVEWVETELRHWETEIPRCQRDIESVTDALAAARAFSARWKQTATRYRRMLAVHRDGDPWRRTLAMHLDRLRTLEDVDKEHAECPSHLAVQADQNERLEAENAALRGALDHIQAITSPEMTPLYSVRPHECAGVSAHKIARCATGAADEARAALARRDEGEGE